jgi:hypothetical protein
VLEQTLGLVLSFRWTGAALAAAVMSFPLMVRAIRLSMEAIDQRTEQAAATLGASPFWVFVTVTLPLSLSGIIAGTTLAFAKALGEFGATITFVSNIPGETQTIPAAIYSYTQTPGGDAGALRLSIVAAVLSLVALVATTGLHVGYRHLVGHYAHSAPGYVGLAGPFELGLVVPLVRPEHFAGTRCPPDILQHIGPPLGDPWLREVHIWRGDGLWPTMRWRCKDPEQAARIVADRALKSNPLGLLPLAWATVRQHFDDPSARWRMDSDLGRNWLGDDFVFAIRELFDFDPAPVPFRDTLTSRAFDGSRWWLTWAYFVTPLYVAALASRARRRRDFPAQAFALMTGLLFGSQLLFSHILSYRYLYAFPVLLIVAIAWWWGAPRSATAAVDADEPQLARAA